MSLLNQQKLALLLQGDMAKLVAYFRKFENGVRDSSITTKIERWRKMENKPISTHPFFQLPDVLEYFKEKVVTREEIIELASSIILNTFGINTSKMFMEHHYDAIFESAQSDYCYLKKFKNQDQPYFKDRFKSEFIEFFLNLHQDVLKQRLHKEILSVSIDGSKYLFPAINLLPENTTPTLDGNLVQRKILNVPETFIEKVTHAKSKNNPTFAVDAIDYSAGEIKCFISSYYRALYSCDIHFYNIISLYPGLNSKSALSYSKHKTIFDWSCALKNILIDNDFSHSELSLGVSCLLVYKTPHGFETILAKKLQDSNGARDAHVIPAGMLQPQLTNPDRYSIELDLEKQILRELAEEVFNYSEDADIDIHPNLYYAALYKKPQIHHLKQLMEQGKANLYVTGLYLDLFRLRPEILTMLVIEDESWYNNQFTTEQKLGNWEYLRGSLMPIDMTDTGFKSVITKNIAGYLCAPGAACYIKGYEKFKSLGLVNN
ncbi:hypothetical protein SJS39_19950 [Aeromonas caviae]|uniref:hypothetical protein n=1 Tax=Aeromonas caviae TaxID=648 RepID=UPI0029DB97A8|nr:hypothetical protein [Aeromonas caviae]MDX7710645.1 hypothetical protein [Aeromonas caviae]